MADLSVPDLTSASAFPDRLIGVSDIPLVAQLVGNELYPSLLPPSPQPMSEALAPIFGQSMRSFGTSAQPMSEVLAPIFGQSFGALSSMLEFADSMAGLVQRFTGSLSPLVSRAGDWVHANRETLALIGSWTPDLEWHAGRAYDRWLCERARQDAIAGHREAVARFTVEVVGLPVEHAPYVAEALTLRRWDSSDKPIAYLATVARRIATRDDVPRKRDALRLVTWNDTDAAAGMEAFDAERSDAAWSQQETVLILQQVIRRRDVTSDVRDVLTARAAGVSREGMATALRWDSRRVEAAWKAAQRLFAKLRRESDA